MRLRLIALWESLRSSYWFVPTLMGLASIVFAYCLVTVNDIIPDQVATKLKWLYSGGPEGARSVLSTIAGSVITVAGTTFSITIAVLALASAQFGPRLLRTFRRDRGNQIVLGTFISTFLYCLLVLRTIVGTDKDRYVPDLAITFGVLLAVLSLAVLIYFIHHTAASIQVSNLLASVERELNCIIEDNFPKHDELGAFERQLDGREDAQPSLEQSAELKACRGGYLIRVDYEALVHYAAEKSCRLLVHLRPGNFSLPDLSLAAITPASSFKEDDRGSLYGHFYFGSERTPEQDPEHAFLQLAEIGVRALSPGTNDPFTAMTCLDKLTESMALIAAHRLPSRYLYDEANTLRVITKGFRYEELVIAAFQFIRKAASQNREVLLHLADRLKLILERAEDPNLHLAVAQQLSWTEQDIQKCQL